MSDLIQPPATDSGDDSSKRDANMINFLDNGPPPPPRAATFPTNASGNITQSRPGFFKRYNEKYTPAKPDPWWQMKLGVGYVPQVIAALPKHADVAAFCLRCPSGPSTS
jgi:hypothetical protein